MVTSISIIKPNTHGKVIIVSHSKLGLLKGCSNSETLGLEQRTSDGMGVAGLDLNLARGLAQLEGAIGLGWILGSTPPLKGLSDEILYWQV